MNILMIGDVFSDCGVAYVRRRLPSLKKEYHVDFCIANGENVTPVGKGTNRDAAEELFFAGVDVITGGNHSYDNPEVNNLFREGYPIIRPANFPPFNEGEGVIVRSCGDKRIAVINLLGRTYMNTVDCPFRALTGILKKLESDITIVDFHGEATSEKRAFAFYADGRVSAVIGTHTHVQTADEVILPKGTAYLTDVGMTGVRHSILGMKKDSIIRKFLSGLPQRFEPETGAVELNAVLLKTEDNRVVSIERIREYDGE